MPDGRRIGGGVVGRFAPSPTGRLHYGSLVAAVGSYLMAKHQGGQWLVRLDDLDTPRQVPGMADDILRTLESFGLFWDGTITRQSRNLQEYERFFESLLTRGKLYPCCCSRKEIAQSASAPHDSDDSVTYPGTCRNRTAPVKTVRSWRLMVPDDDICFTDLRKGHVCQNLTQWCGDIVLRRGNGDYTYQLAVVIDDHITGVNQVVRGEDLLSSTPRQIYLHRLLDFPLPDYCHLPLVINPDGSKLSKRDNLVSHLTSDLPSNSASLLHAVLNFLGCTPPAELVSYPCTTILDWGVTHFSPAMLPATSRPFIY